MSVQPSFKKDGEALLKFLQFDMKLNILHGNKAGKAPSLFIICCSDFVRSQNHTFTTDSNGGFAIIREHRSAHAFTTDSDHGFAIIWEHRSAVSLLVLYL